MAIFVDDGLVCSNRVELQDEVLNHLRAEFEMRTLPPNRYLGFNIKRDRTNHHLFISQPDYVDEILRKFNMAQCNPRSTPADPGARLTVVMSPRTEQQAAEMINVPYREAIGSLMFVMVTTRPDIAYAVGQVAQHAENPGPAHWKAVKRIFAYLAGTKNYGLRFGPKSPLIGYSDADYGGDPDRRRSTSGFLFLLHGGPISWASRRQSCTALSTTEAEFIAASEATKEATWLLRLLKEIDGEGTTGPVELLCDSQSAIRLVKNPEFHQRTKHIDVRYNFIRDQQADGIVNMKFVQSKDQLADVFTKPLPTPAFERLRNDLGVIELPSV